MGKCPDCGEDHGEWPPVVKDLFDRLQPAIKAFEAWMQGIHGLCGHLHMGGRHTKTADITSGISNDTQDLVLKALTASMLPDHQARAVQIKLVKHEAAAIASRKVLLPEHSWIRWIVGEMVPKVITEGIQAFLVGWETSKRAVDRFNWDQIEANVDNMRKIIDDPADLANMSMRDLMTDPTEDAYRKYVACARIFTGLVRNGEPAEIAGMKCNHWLKTGIPVVQPPTDAEVMELLGPRRGRVGGPK